MAALWTTLGWIGQGCYFARFFIQWLASEKARRSAAPRVFWWLSLAGVLLVGGAAIDKHEWVLVPAFGVNAAVYARNLWLSRSAAGEGGLGPIPAGLIGLAAAGVLIAGNVLHQGFAPSLAWPWLVAGILGQTIWATRFPLQWWFSERRGLSHFPRAFWWLSLAGAFLNIAYTSQLQSPLFLVGYLPAWLVPIRNLMLEAKSARRV